MKSSSRILLGIDPGTRVTGFGLIQLDVRREQIVHLSHGAIVLPAGDRFAEKLAILSENLLELLQKYAPDVVVVEKIFLGKNVASAFQLGHARGVVFSEAVRWARTQGRYIEIREQATRAVKKALTGNGGAEKTHVAAAVERILGIRGIEPLDASDALALAIAEVQRERAQILMADGESGPSRRKIGVEI